MEDKKKLKELAKQLLELADDKDCEWFDKAELSQEDIDKIKKFGNDPVDDSLVFRILWTIIKELEEIKKNQTLSCTGTYPVIQPYNPYSPYTSPSVPKPWEVWYENRTSPCLDPFGPVTCTYSDTEGHEVTFDGSKPMAVTYTYSSGSSNLTNPFDEK